MTVENFLRGVVTDSLPNFNGNIHDANGMSFPEFLSEKSTETPSIFISYEGFSDVEYYSDGSGNVLTENYSLYIRCNDSVKTHVKALMVALGGKYSEFTDKLLAGKRSVTTGLMLLKSLYKLNNG